jgi:DNA-binding GntR family transcriptional regulator
MTIAQSDRAARSIVDHMRIIEALEARDTELAERLVRQHSLDLAAHVDAHCDFSAEAWRRAAASTVRPSGKVQCAPD